ncbi:MAG: AsmA family protein [Kiritimatiellaceae bacterium]|nr:AsmA family protein [Kiritimatiellaceae bacterium]
MKKLLKIILGLLAVLVVALVCLVLFWLGPTVKKSVETVGPKALGTEVTIEKLRIHPLLGTVQLKGLHIGNPEGFTNPSAVALKEFKVIVSLRSLLTDTVVVKEILIDSPEFTYERKLKTDNIKVLQKNIEAYTAKEEASEAELEQQIEQEKAEGEQPTDKPAKKIVIERLALINGKVNAKISALPTAPIPLPDIEKTDIGKDDGGTSWAEAGKEISTTIYDAIFGAVSSVGGIAGDALKGAGGSAVDAGKAAGDTVKDAGSAVIDSASDAVKNIGGLFKKKEE